MKSLRGPWPRLLSRRPTKRRPDRTGNSLATVGPGCHGQSPTRRQEPTRRSGGRVGLTPRYSSRRRPLSRKLARSSTDARWSSRVHRRSSGSRQRAADLRPERRCRTHRPCRTRRQRETPRSRTPATTQRSPTDPLRPRSPTYGRTRARDADAGGPADGANAVRPACGKCRLWAIRLTRLATPVRADLKPPLRGALARRPNVRQPR